MLFLMRALSPSLILSVVFSRIKSGQAVQTSKLQILIPKELSKPGDGYDHRDALFGVPPYGGSIQQQVYYADQSLCTTIVDAKIGYPQRPDGSPWKPPFILLVDRGECSFVQKARNAQRAGATGLLIADDMCLCSRPQCSITNEQEICESQEPLMADDGSGADISIPSFLIFKEDADEIKAVLKQNQHVRAQMSFKVPAPDSRVEYELWTTASDPVSRPIEQSFGAAAQALKEHASFTPHLYIYDGARAGCYLDGENQCYTLCTNNGRYCSTDPDGDLDTGASGADVVVEALRRICIWKKYGEEDGIGKAWWAYVRLFLNNCDTPDPLNPDGPSKFNDANCINQAMTEAGLDVAAVDQCMKSSGEISETSNSTNALLDKELKDQDSSGVVLIPSLVVNGAVVRGSMSFATVLKAICSGFSTGSEPSVCKECSGCIDEFDCVVNGVCAVRSGYSSEPSGVPIELFAGVLMGLTVFFCITMAVQYHRTQVSMRDQVRGIVQEYMPVTSQNTRFGDTSVGIPDDDPRNNDDETDNENSPNGKSSFSIT